MCVQGTHFSLAACGGETSRFNSHAKLNRVPVIKGQKLRKEGMAVTLTLIEKFTQPSPPF